MGYSESFETVAGCRTRLMRGGEGEPLLFLHGAGGGRVWLPFMESLSQRYEIIVPEHPGFGGSDTPEWLDTVGDLAFFYLDLIEQLGLQGVNLVGASMGGWIAAELAVRDDGSLSTLTLIAAGGNHVNGVRKGDIFMWSPEESARNVFHDQSFAERMLAEAPSSEDELMMLVKNRLTTAKLGWQPRLHNPHLRKWLHRIKVPTLVIWGDDDQVLPLAYGEAWRDLIPRAHLEVIANCGHLAQIEKAARVVDLVTAHIEENRS
jgi:pimeloyl-ACP methyl ester carboxylesterase